MPTRNFCDLCDERIDDGEPYYATITSRHNVDRSQSWNADLLIDSVRVNPESAMTHDMVCEECVRAFLKLTLTLNKEFKS